MPVGHDAYYARPLAEFTTEARELGFALEYQDRALMGKLHRFTVRLSPTTERAREAVIAASGSEELETITSRTDYVEGEDDMWDVSRQTAGEALDIAKGVLR